MRVAVILSSMGGPANEAGVAPYLEQLFSDPMLMHLPLQSVLGPLLARRVASRSRRKHSAIGFGHGLRWSTAQAQGVAQRLATRMPEHSFVPMQLCRYGEPNAAQLCSRLLREGVDEALLIGVDPQFSCCTMGSSLAALWGELARHDLLRRLRWTVLSRWGQDEGIAKAWAARIDEALEAWSDEQRAKGLLLYTAHALPLSQLERGDLYVHEVHATVAAIHRQLRHELPMQLAFQSASPRGQWLGPTLETVCRGLGRSGPRPLLVVPVSFGCEHSETLYDLDVEAFALARTLGLTQDTGEGGGVGGWQRLAAANAHAGHLDALTELAHRRLLSGPSFEVQLGERCHSCSSACVRLPVAQT